ncbi:diguanylate cyclase [Nitrosomonas sp. PY1]|uniref:GGDEF domain-containing protein n=1 Tax=Nitrosomonas sp. PY1 TaxID=1803906 RepID=UPI001FC7FFAD|nr:GGDEF domain-containing protein [Nitrosomonas sp. PY1]GKS68304.1 diguanylate cyclase [Nitrosomonas sp. PY1]
MNELKNANPTIVARETLKQLATLKIPPTPDNYYKLYNQIAGVSDSSVEANSLSADATANQAIDNANSISESPLNWGETLEMLLKQLESKHGKLTVAKKREGVTRVLSKFSKDSSQLHIKLKGLIDSWGALAAVPPKSSQDDLDERQKVPLELTPSVESVIAETENTQRLLLDEQDIQIDIDQIVDVAGQILGRIVACQIEDTTLSEEAKELAHQIRQVSSQSELALFVTCFQQFYSNFNAYDKDQKTLRQGLLKLLGMLMDSTGELLAGDQWIKNQIDKLRITMSKPLNQAVIEEAEQCLGVITQKQDQIRLSLNEAKTTLKQMVTSIITNIEELTDATGEYQEKLEDYSDKISKADDIVDINQLLGLIMGETKQMQKNAHSYRNDFLAARAEVSKAQEKINQLETDLMEMGEKVHEDHLTGILNRRGLDSAFMRETARSIRHRISLCYALLDIDNFKQLNDTHGHKVGDDALIYLVQSIKETTRPEDVVSRYGGEEFVVLLPNTEKEEAFEVLSRIRRNLTKKFFLHDNNRLLITFSAGIAQFSPGESQESIFKRADEALYRAKKSGKNQILMAE